MIDGQLDQADIAGSVSAVLSRGFSPSQPSPMLRLYPIAICKGIRCCSREIVFSELDAAFQEMPW